MSFLKKIIYLYFFTGILVSCKKEKNNEGIINGDLYLSKDKFDAVAIEMRGYELLGDSIITTDTIEAINGKFTYKFNVPESKLIRFELLKKKKFVGSLSLANKNYTKNSKTIPMTFGNFYVGNENITLTENTNINPRSSNGKNFIVNSDNTKENDIFQNFNTNKIQPFDIESNTDSYAILHNLFWQKDNYSNAELNSMMQLFSDDLKQAKSYKILKKYLVKKIDLEKNGYTTNFNWVDIDSTKHTFKQALNNKKYMLLVFWASWCGPCRAEIPDLKEFNKKYGKTISLVSLSIDESYDNWKKAVLKEKMPWSNLSGLPLDKFGIKKEYNIEAVPNLILLDQNGKVIINNINELNEIKKYIDTNE
ncbi:TlpA disulfide reductase family protein [Flavobacterium sp.]|uniref:TlpA family protein disulfide reductase n=1 Tax=Flavobacterium sp. TaxID=239 RepID=UPI00260F1080|nr:TlpA disulfide reductase family protein [Flavobacterium sp.]